MDIEFHYYMTYLVAKKAKFSNKEAQIIAHSSQYVDENKFSFEIDKGKATFFRSYISQTMNILKPKKKLLRIYPIFHFIPGDPTALSTRRKDGKMHWLNTTPNSENANKILSNAFSTNNLYRIGIASHGYVDTWAHQNFVGYFDSFNAMGGPLADVTPNIGHADAQHKPDWPALRWKDNRLLIDTVDNKTRFLDAAEHLFQKLLFVSDATKDQETANQWGVELRSDLDTAIGETDPHNKYQQTRIARYKALAETSAYGDESLPNYDEAAWFEEAVGEEVRGLKDRKGGLWGKLHLLDDRYHWLDSANYKDSHWYQFQNAVIKHQNASWEILNETTFQNLELPEL